MKCFYHADNDGKCAAYWVYKDAVNKDNYGREFIEINYGIPFPIKTIKPDEEIYIVDYSIEVEEMRKLLQITRNVIWIDHHKSAIEKYNDFETPIEGIRYDGVAGCMLTYCYLNHMTYKGTGNKKSFDLSMTELAPEFTKLIADWDVWTFKYGDRTREFNMGFELYDKDPSSESWSMMEQDSSVVDDIVEKGKLLIQYRDVWASEYCKSKGYEINFEGYKCFAMNLGSCNSEYFKSIADDYDILIPYYYNGKVWMYSLYSEKVDVSEIAKKYGGGGHKGASGFQIDKFILKGDN